MSQAIDPAGEPAAAAPALDAAGAAQPEANTLLTGEEKPEGEDQAKEAPKEKEPGDEGKDQDKAATVPESPDGYELSFADAAGVDTALLGQFKTTAHELGLNQTQAAKLAALYESHAAGQVQRHIEAVREAEKGWLAELRADKGFAVDMTHARAALKEYGSEELMLVLEQSRMGSHPALVRFVAKVGKALAEPGFKATSGAGASKSMAETLYPNHGK